VTPPLNCGT